MLTGRVMKILLPMALFGVFAFGVIRLFELRFAQGDVYPPYSTLRADPLGARAIHDSLKEVSGEKVRRLFEPLSRLEGGRDTTLFVLGGKPWEDEYLPESEFKELEKFMHEGGRIVVAYRPFRVPPWNNKLRNIRYGIDSKDSDKSKGKGDEQEGKLREWFKQRMKKKRDSEPDENGRKSIIRELKLIALGERWGIRHDWKKSDSGRSGTVLNEWVERLADEANLPDGLNWHTACIFKLDEKSDWKTIYARGDDPVVVERKFGDGSIVFCADAFAFSNQALRHARQTEFLTWLAAGNSRLVFNETHLGVVTTEGVATLGRRYRLHGLVGGLIVLALLFIWKNVVSLVPPFDDAIHTADGAAVEGRDSAAGFVNLLRRGISRGRLLNVCCEQWEKSFAHGNAHLRKKATEAKAVLERANAQESKPPTPVQLYRELNQIFRRKL